MGTPSRSVDAGVQDVVAMLNRVPGVSTRASCQGAAAGPEAHAHSELAYVAFRYPLPLRLQEFLHDRLQDLARIEDDHVYSRWRARNQEFLARLGEVIPLYGHVSEAAPASMLREPLAKLRARLARQFACKQASAVRLCFACRALVLAPHRAEHAAVQVLTVSSSQTADWFAEFVGQPGNGLDPTLIRRDGWERLAVLSARGDFGASFHRRWLRYRARKIAECSTTELRRGAIAARRQRPDLDFYYDRRHAVFAWQEALTDNPDAPR